MSLPWSDPPVTSQCSCSEVLLAPGRHLATFLIWYPGTPFLALHASTHSFCTWKTPSLLPSQGFSPAVPSVYHLPPLLKAGSSDVLRFQFKHCHLRESSPLLPPQATFLLFIWFISLRAFIVLWDALVYLFPNPFYPRVRLMRSWTFPVFVYPLFAASGTQSGPELGAP